MMIAFRLDWIELKRALLLLQAGKMIHSKTSSPLQVLLDEGLGKCVEVVKTGAPGCVWWKMWTMGTEMARYFSLWIVCGSGMNLEYGTNEDTHPIDICTWYTYTRICSQVSLKYGVSRLGELVLQQGGDSFAGWGYVLSFESAFDTPRSIWFGMIVVIFSEGHTRSERQWWQGRCLSLSLMEAVETRYRWVLWKILPLRGKVEMKLLRVVTLGRERWYIRG